MPALAASEWAWAVLGNTAALQGGSLGGAWPWSKPRLARKLSPADDAQQLCPLLYPQVPALWPGTEQQTYLLSRELTGLGAAGGSCPAGPAAERACCAGMKGGAPPTWSESLLVVGLLLSAHKLTALSLSLSLSGSGLPQKKLPPEAHRGFALLALDSSTQSAWPG